MFGEKLPVKIVGVINPYVAMMADQLGAQALYVSGAAVANYEWGLPDLALTTLDEVANVVFRIRSKTKLPILVDIDTGWGSSLMIERSIKYLMQAGASAVHIEDQVFEKRCGHRGGKEVVPISIMQERIDAAIGARGNTPFLIGARSDAYEKEGLIGVIERAKAYSEADFFFPDALPDVKDYIAIKEQSNLPVLINQTEFGKTPLYSWQELTKLDFVLYPLSVVRGMNFQAKAVLESIINKGSVKQEIEKMQTRSELYQFLDYESYEKRASHGNNG